MRDEVMNSGKRSLPSVKVTTRSGMIAERERLLAPDRVGLGDQLMAVGNRKNANLVVDGLVHDAIGSAEGLAKRGRLFVMALAGEDFEGVAGNAKDDAVGLIDSDTPPTTVCARSCCDRRPCRGRGVPARGCWIHRRTDRQELQRAVCRVGRTAERKR